jgi:nickel-dependent lactate racemase
VLGGNPLQAAIDAVLALAPPAFLVQVAFQRGRRPAGIFAGDVHAAHRAAADFHRRWQERAVGAPADLVVASAGGAPWDLNLYQAHKALEAACRAVRPGGTVVLAAACAEGAGSDAFAASLRHPTPDALERALRADFSIAGHTALALRRKAAAARCILVSDGIDPALARGLGFTPARDLDEALALAGPAARTLVLPDGGRTLPVADGPTAAGHA